MYLLSQILSPQPLLGGLEIVLFTCETEIYCLFFWPRIYMIHIPREPPKSKTKKQLQSLLVNGFSWNMPELPGIKLLNKNDLR